MAFFDRLKDGLKKTKDAVFGQVNNIFKAFVKVDEELLEELEELLIMADTGVASAEEIIEKLNASFPKGLRAYACYTPAARFCDIKWGLYEIKYELCGEVPADVCEKAKAALTAEEITVEKFSKKTGPKTVNIADGIRFCSADIDGNVLTVRAKLSCDDLAFVNPKYVGETLAKAMPELFEGAEEETCRMEVYLDDGETLFR